MESALAPNGFIFALNTSLPWRSPQRFSYISMIFSDLKHMCPKAEAVAAKYSTLLQGSSYLWNSYYKIHECHDRLPDQAGINKVRTRGHGMRQSAGLEAAQKLITWPPGKLSQMCFCRVYSFERTFAAQSPLQLIYSRTPCHIY